MPQRLFKRGDTWFCAFYIDGRRIKRSTHCRDRRAAEIAAARIEREAADPRHAASHATTLEDALVRVWSDRKARGRAQGTLDMHATKAGHWNRILGPATPLAQIDARAVDSFIATRQEEGAAQSTIGKELTTLRVALKIALRRGEWTGRVDAVMPEGFSVEYKPRSRALSEAELPRLLAELAPHRAAHVAFIVGTGARWAESVRARREDVSAAALRIRGTKTAASARTVPLLGFMRRLVSQALGGAGESVLFRPWASVRRDLAAACARARIEPVTPNDLRRTCATWLRAAGVEPSLIAAVLGHADSRMVERVYGRVPADALAALLAVHLDGTAAGQRGAD